eukprot:GILI01069703.1.p1 GENE.GILI01069703.1~~GILI01069703.1.p1  ORF type:complete len:147 (-),score=22.60 GILI01069703.1:27-467(-)
MDEDDDNPPVPLVSAHIKKKSSAGPPSFRPADKTTGEVVPLGGSDFVSPAATNPFGVAPTSHEQRAPVFISFSSSAAASSASRGNPNHVSYDAPDPRTGSEEEWDSWLLGRSAALSAQSPPSSPPARQCNCPNRAGRNDPTGREPL